MAESDDRRRVGEVGAAGGERGDHDVGHVAVGVGDQRAPVLLVHGPAVRCRGLLDDRAGALDVVGRAERRAASRRRAGRRA